MKKSLNRGKYKTHYCISIVQRGHVNARDKDIVVRFKGRIIEKLGYSRPYSGRNVIVMDQSKLSN